MLGSVVVPTLRDNLRLLPGTPDEDGAPRWLLYDVVRNKYFAISERAVSLIRHWQPGFALESFLSFLQKKNIEIDAEELHAFVRFLVANNLVLARDQGSCAGLYQQGAGKRVGVWKWLLHNYLFIRIPLVRPDVFLGRHLSLFSFLFSPAFHFVILFLGFLGILMVIHQWDEFWSTFLYFFSFEGVLVYGVTLALVKCLHELGHAIVAKRYGCRVASMGIAFLVMFPVLYTDTTDAWRLRSRKDRLRIVSAGVWTELYIALLATFVWAVLPDGSIKSAAFFLATTSWVTSLLVNISPFLRFDGYYAFSDLIGVENLQQRAFELGRWKMRRLLWGWPDPLPEPMPRYRVRLLFAYAWATWLYRFFLFLGIALLVYHFFFKVLGIFLFVIEILWFIVMPVIRELAVWFKRRKEFRLTWRRSVFFASMFFLIVIGAFPFSVAVSLPAVVRSEQHQIIYPAESALISLSRVSHGDNVTEGEEMIVLHSPELEFHIERTRQEIAMERVKLSRQASSLDEKTEYAVTMRRLQQLERQLRGLDERKSKLSIYAPFSGGLDLLEPVHVGRWVNKEQPLISLRQELGIIVEGFVSELDVRFLSEGDKAVFIADRGDFTLGGLRLERMELSAIPSLPYPELGSDFGGHMAARQLREGRLVPEQARYKVMFDHGDLDDIKLDGRMTGIIVVEGARRSWLGYQLQQVASALIRESGF